VWSVVITPIYKLTLDYSISPILDQKIKFYVNNRPKYNQSCLNP
jgi:hypothetical protein